MSQFAVVVNEINLSAQFFWLKIVSKCVTLHNFYCLITLLPSGRSLSTGNTVKHMKIQSFFTFSNVKQRAGLESSWC